MPNELYIFTVSALLPQCSINDLTKYVFICISGKKLVSDRWSSRGFRIQRALMKVGNSEGQKNYWVLQCQLMDIINASDVVRENINIRCGKENGVCRHCTNSKKTHAECREQQSKKGLSVMKTQLGNLPLRYFVWLVKHRTKCCKVILAVHYLQF